MSFWSSGKDTKSLVQLRKEYQKALMDGDDDKAERLRKQIEELKKSLEKNETSGKKQPMSGRKSIIT